VGIVIERKCCAFTGHRPHKLPWKYNEGDERCISLKAALTDQITALVDAGVTDFYSGGADGVDCWAALIVLELRKNNPMLRLHCILPHEGQADKWSDSAQERYHFILSQADSVEYVSHDYYDGCMIDRNHRLVEAAGLLLLSTTVSGGVVLRQPCAILRRQDERLLFSIPYLLR